MGVLADRWVRPEHREKRHGVRSGSVCAGFFAIMSGFNVLGLKPGRYYLELTPRGLTERLVFIRRARRWSDFDGFSLATSGDGFPVELRYSDAYRSRIPA